MFDDGSIFVIWNLIKYLKDEMTDLKLQGPKWTFQDNFRDFDKMNPEF